MQTRRWTIIYHPTNITHHLHHHHYNHHSRNNDDDNDYRPLDLTSCPPAPPTHIVHKLTHQDHKPRFAWEIFISFPSSQGLYHRSPARPPAHPQPLNAHELPLPFPSFVVLDIFGSLIVFRHKKKSLFSLFLILVPRDGRQW